MAKAQRTLQHARNKSRVWHAIDRQAHAGKTIQPQNGQSC